ncbi:MAG: divalent-cation tolerance protein CutA [Gammaproteobacteria bacterium]
MPSKPQLILCTVPDRASAERIAETLVAEQLAACVNIIPGITSVYRWKGTLEKDEELLLFIKTSEAVYDSLEQRIRALHPYELPEIIAVPIQTGQEDYIRWIENSLISS